MNGSSRPAVPLVSLLAYVEYYYYHVRSLYSVVRHIRSPKYGVLGSKTKKGGGTNNPQGVTLLGINHIAISIGGKHCLLLAPINGTVGLFIATILYYWFLRYVMSMIHPPESE